MEQAQEELKAHLMATNDEFRRLAAEHSGLDRELDAIEGKPHVTPEDEVVEHQIKKQKLKVKDQMNQVMSRYREQLA